MLRVAILAALLSSCAATRAAMTLGGAALPPRTVSGMPVDEGLLRGKVVMVTFMTTWCFPCLAELVSLRALEKEFGAQGYVNLYIGLDREGAEVLEPFAQEYELGDSLIVADEFLKSGKSAFGLISEVPHRFLFRRNGRLAQSFTGPEDYKVLRERVRRLIAEQ